MRSLALALELSRWRRAGRTARLWWRDDDAAGSAALGDQARLDRLLEVSWAAAAPLTLAVVPVGDLGGLAARLAGADLVTAAQHGVDHRNRLAGPVAGEFPPDWSRTRLEAELAQGWARIEGLPRTAKAFMPPWNDVHPELPAALAAQGYAALSANGRLAGDDDGPLPRLDAHLDLLRWRGGARFRGRHKFLKSLADELARRRRTGRWDAPIGFLTHHLAHDAPAWRFLADFLAWTRGRPELAWRALPDLLSEPIDAGAR
ncbi:MAG: polysaccharide deacetylase [Proteobacteria bacterium]|nr:polysaccharide deacetylase [Pseudomonadota bacterium]